MKTKNLFISLLLAFTTVASAQDITGDWNGVLKVGGMQMRLVFHITKTVAGLSATMDSPDQGAKGIPMSKTSFENQILTIDLATATIHFTGTLDNAGVVNGTFNQGGQAIPLVLSRKRAEKVETKRPQEPTKPYPYYSEEVSFENIKEHFTLAGTLTLPRKEGKFSVAILITGSGPQNRDEELMGHKPFLVLSDYLTRNGIAVLRYDDRGSFASKGNFSTATSFDFATDVESAVSYLRTRKDIDSKHIGLIGHSEGGIIAPMVAAKDKELSFIVLMAGTGISGADLLLLQQHAIGKISGISEADLKTSADINRGAFKIVCNHSDTISLKADMTTYLKSKISSFPASQLPKGMDAPQLVKVQTEQLCSPWMASFIRYNPAPTLEKVSCPVLAINGDKDLQVDSKVNLPAIENALKKGGNNKVTIKELPGLNHLFQECKTGAPKEYAEIEQTFSPVALEVIGNWVKTVSSY